MCKLLPTCTWLERNPANGTLRLIARESPGERGVVHCGPCACCSPPLVVKCGEILQQEMDDCRNKLNCFR